MQKKTINASRNETRIVRNEWAAEAEARGATVSVSSWSACGAVSASGVALSGTAASATAAITGCGSITNTVTLSNGETLKATRLVEVPCRTNI